MDAFIYNADVYCESCGKAIRDHITKEGHAPADPDDETTYDSGEFPKGPYDDGSGESDVPQHCGSGPDCLNPTTLDDGATVGAFLENPLTSDGYDYVRSTHLEEPTAVTRLWVDFYDVDLEPILRSYDHPGKFEGGLIIDEWAYNETQTGCDDEAGDCQTTGWYGRLDGPFTTDGPFASVSATAVLDMALTRDELRFLASQVGAIVFENSDGFVDVTWYEKLLDFRRAWDRVESSVAEDMADDDDDNETTDSE